MIAIHHNYTSDIVSAMLLLLYGDKVWNNVIRWRISVNRIDGWIQAEKKNKKQKKD